MILETLIGRERTREMEIARRAHGTPVAAAFVLALLGAAAVACAQEEATHRRPPAAERDVAVGDHSLHVRTTGETTVVLEAAFGDGLAIWSPVQDAVSAFARVVAYDRAGLGASEPGPLPRTPARIAGELHALLAAIEASPPYVLIGHSAGGLHVRAFAARYPDEVGALVLVDASHEKQDHAFRAVSPERWTRERAAHEARIAQAPEGIRREWDALRDIFDAGMLEEAASLPNVPTIVLSAARIEPDSPWLGRTPEGVEAWLELHASWVDGHPRALHVVTGESGHYLHAEQPRLVVAAIREACRVVRGGGNLSIDAVRAEAAERDAPREHPPLSDDR